MKPATVEGAEDKPDRVVKRDTSTTDEIKKLLTRSTAETAKNSGDGSR